LLLIFTGYVRDVQNSGRPVGLYVVSSAFSEFSSFDRCRWYYLAERYCLSAGALCWLYQISPGSAESCEFRHILWTGNRVVGKWVKRGIFAQFLGHLWL